MLEPPSFDGMLGVSEFEEVTVSVSACPPKIGRCRRRCPGCWALSASVACWMSVDEDMDRWSIISDRLLFFSIGFFEAKELLRERPVVEGRESIINGLPASVCRGP